MLGGWFECSGCVTKVGRHLMFVCLLRPDCEGVIFFFWSSLWLVVTSDIGVLGNDVHQDTLVQGPMPAPGRWKSSCVGKWCCS